MKTIFFKISSILCLACIGVTSVHAANSASTAGSADNAFTTAVTKTSASRSSGGSGAKSKAKNRHTKSAAQSTAAASSSGAAMAASGKISRHDRNFLQKAADINLAEIELGRAAEKNSANPEVKKMASHIVKDHSEAMQALEHLAASKGVAFFPDLPRKDRRTVNRIKSQTGGAFDQHFVAFNLKGHEEAVQLFEKEAARTQDPDIRAWAQKMIPSLRSHLALAQKNGQLQAVAEKREMMQRKTRDMQQQMLHTPSLHRQQMQPYTVPQPQQQQAIPQPLQ